MRLTEARALSAGDYVVSPYTEPPFRPLRVTEVRTTDTHLLLIRIHKLRASTQMADGWCLPTSFMCSPEGYKWSSKDEKWKNGGGCMSESELVAAWRRDRADVAAEGASNDQ